MKKINPAVKNMAQLMLYLVLLIVIWIVIGSIVFPKQSAASTVKSYVEKNSAVLVQVAENAMDENVNPGIQNSVEVLNLLGKGDISSVFAYEQGAAFAITGKNTPKGGHLYLLYLPDGQYSFPYSGDWEAATADSEGTLRWTSGSSYVAVTRLADGFFLEEAVLPQ